MNERERLQKIRDQQIAARYDGMSGRLRYIDKMKNVKVTQKQKTASQKFFGLLEPRLMGAMLGGVFGMLLMLFMNIWYSSGSLLGMLSIIAPIIGAIGGYILGKAFEL